MNMLTTISNSIIPMVISAVVLYGCIKKTNVYEDFIDGAFNGMKIVVELVPTLIGLFVAVRILNDSGALDLITTALKPIASLIHTPDCVIPVIITKMFSSGSATSLMLNIFNDYGPDSREGLTAAIILSCTESLFYTMSVYLMAAKVRKSRYIIPCALLSLGAGIVVSILLANMLVS